MDIDAALHELGMLSSVTESRRQYLLECRRKQGRERTTSEPPTASIPQPTSLPKSSFTPKNSPTKGGFHILHINPTFVTNLVTTSPTKQDVLARIDRDTLTEMNQDQENIEIVRRRVRHARQTKRFKKPYEIPWLQRRSRELPGSPTHTGSGDSRSSLCSLVVPLTKIDLEGLDKQRLSTKTSNENSNSDEQSCSSVSCDKTSELLSVPRSRSLDELDFAKLRVAEQENQNYLLERREIENVSQHLQNLNVSE